MPLFPASHVALTGDRGETSCVLFELTVDGVGTIRVCEGDAPEAVAAHSARSTTCPARPPRRSPRPSSSRWNCVKMCSVLSPPPLGRRFCTSSLRGRV